MDLSSIDWNALLKMVEEIISLFSKKQMFAAGPMKHGRDHDFCVEDCCCHLLCVQAEILKDAVAFHSECHTDEACCPAKLARAERLLANAACAIHCAVAMHQHCCHHKDGEK